MISQTKTKRGRFLESMTHYITAFVVIMKGIDKIDVAGKAFFGVLFISIGLVILLGAIFHHKVESRIRNFKAYAFALEAVVMALVGYIFMKDGKQMIQYLCFFAAAMFLVAIVVYLRRNKTAPSSDGH
jgi:hypothetical protein